LPRVRGSSEAIRCVRGATASSSQWAQAVTTSAAAAELCRGLHKRSRLRAGCSRRSAGRRRGEASPNLGGTVLEDRRYTEAFETGFGCKLILANPLEVPLLLDGIWVKSGERAHGTALEAQGISGSAAVFVGGTEVDMLLWFQAPCWPYNVLTLAVSHRHGGQTKVAGEWARSFSADARQLMNEGSVLQSGVPLEKTGLSWHLVPETGSLAVIQVVVQISNSRALLTRSSLDLLPPYLRPEPWRAWVLPSPSEVAGWMFGSGQVLNPKGLRQQLEAMGAEEQPLADVRLFFVLGIKQTATPRMVRAAWRRRAQELHPDRSGEADRSQFDEAREAFRVLSDPVLRARYEDLGAVGMDSVEGAPPAEDGSSFDGFVTVLQLLLGGWALRPLLGGPLTPPLGISLRNNNNNNDNDNNNNDNNNTAETTAGAAPATPATGQKRNEENALQALQAALASEMRAALGLYDSSEAESSEVASQIRAALATASMLHPVIDDRAEFDDCGLRRDIQALVRVAEGTLAPYLLARLGSAILMGTESWLAREAPVQWMSSPPALVHASDILMSPTNLRQREEPGQQPDVEPMRTELQRTPSLLLAQAASNNNNNTGALELLSLAGIGAASLATLPGIALAALVAPGTTQTQRATEVAVELMLDVALRTAMLEVDRRGQGLARRLLEEEGRPWQLRWRCAQALRRFASLLQEEGELGSPDLAALIRGV
ncbi:unnamed protein product, partial [Polarella glacialis]